MREKAAHLNGKNVEHVRPSTAEAMAMLDEVDASPSLVNIARAARTLGPHAGTYANVPLRVACLASFTFEPILPALSLLGLRAGFVFDLYVSPYGQFMQELLDTSSGLARFGADVVLLALRLQDVCPDVYERFNSLHPEEARQQISEWHERLFDALSVFRKSSQARLMIQNYDLPAAAAMGIAEDTITESQTRIIADANTTLRERVAGMKNAYRMDYDALVARQGRVRWADPRTALYARIPVAPQHYWTLAGFYVRHLRPLYGLSKKVLVLDADHTLWGGVVGDVGLGGIELGPDYPGSAFVAFQKRVLDLHRRGVVLCLASKNRPEAVMEALEKHPAMVLRPEHFSAVRINWLPKPDNLREMARELNLGLDSFVFVDDNPVECRMVQQTMPQVRCVCLPKEPAEFSGVIDNLDCFDQWTVSDEDRRRGELYRAENERSRLREAVVDLPSFYRQLAMVMTLAVDNATDAARAAQMSVRTNQFNMTTRRYTEDEILEIIRAKDRHLVTLSLKDRFGDHGMIGMALISRSESEWTLEALLMSCRVLGRCVEQSFIRWIAARAASAGAHRLVGLFSPTPKNEPFAGFYSSCCFEAEIGMTNPQRWVWALEKADTTIEDWMTVVVRAGGEIS